MYTQEEKAKQPGKGHGKHLEDLKSLEGCLEEVKSGRSMKENGGDEEGHSHGQDCAYSSWEP